MKITNMNPFFIAGCIGVIIIVIFYVLLGVMVAAMVTADGKSTDSFERIVARWPSYIKTSEEDEEENTPIH